MRDFRKLQNDPPSGVSGAPMDNNIMLWQAVIFGYVARCSLATTASPQLRELSSWVKIGQECALLLVCTLAVHDVLCVCE